MRRVAGFILAFCILIAPGLAAAQSPPPEKRIALVVGNAAYQAGALNTPSNDAGLIAQTLQAAGFDVVGARDLDQDSLRRAFRDFVEKAQSSGSDTVAFVYLSGYGLQLEGENYFVSVDAKISRDTDVTAEALRISDYTRPLAALKLKGTLIVLDAARANPFAKSGAPLAGGLALVDPESGGLIAFNAAPGTVAPEGQGPYGAYAQALAEMMREGGLPLGEMFERIRLRVNDATKGGEVPWHVSKLQGDWVFFERAPDAPPPAALSDQISAMRARPIRDLGAQDAYVVVLERDTLQGYLGFLAAYPSDPLAKRVRAIVAARREAITWRHTRMTDTPPAYWSYVRRYPRGPHVADARRRLASLTASLEPPSSFTMIEYDVLPPPPDEVVYVDRPILAFDDPDFAFAEPPRPPPAFLAPVPPEFVDLPPPPRPTAFFVLPMPTYRPVPLWVRPPQYVTPPPNNVIYTNLHNTVIINNTTNTVTITNNKGQTTTLAPPAPPPPNDKPSGPPPVAVGVLGPALPPSVAKKAVSMPPPPTPGTPPPAGAVTTPPAGTQPPKPPGGTPPKPPAMTNITPPAGQPPKAPGPKPPGPPKPAAATANAPSGGQPPKAPGPKPPGPPKPPAAATANAPSGGQPPKAPGPKPPGPPKPPAAATANAPSGGQPPKAPGPKPPGPPKPAAATANAPSGGQPPKAPGPKPPGPPAATAKQPPKPPAAASKQSPPAAKKKCPIVNGVENCKGT